MKIKALNQAESFIEEYHLDHLKSVIKEVWVNFAGKVLKRDLNIVTLLLCLKKNLMPLLYL